MLKAINTMANLIRPAADRRTTRHTRSRSPPPDIAKHAAHQQQLPSAPTALHPLSTASSQHPEALAAPAVVAVEQTSPARENARKRPVSEIDTPEAQPHAKNKQRRSYDGLATGAIQSAKEGRTISNVDHIPSGASTPRPVDATQDTPSMVDKKTLRSKDAVRKASALADIFEDYDDIISKWEDGEAVESNLSSLASDDQIAIVDEPLSAAQLKEFRETLRQTAERARADRPPPNPNHAYIEQPPFDFTPYVDQLPATTQDPLADIVYTKVHNKHEGGERKSRNRERDNLQYKMSKAQPVLEELESEDWHKVFVIDKSVREDWEPKRAYFIRELRTAISKQDALRDIELKKRRKEKEKRARELESPSSDASSSEDEHTKPKRPPRRSRPSNSQPSPQHPSPPQPRRPPRPHGFILDIPPAPVNPPSAFKSFYQKGTRPLTLSAPPNPHSTTGAAPPANPSARPSSSRATRSADAPPFGVPLPAILTRIDDATLLKMLREDQKYAAAGEPTEDALLDDERSFQCFKLGGGFVTSEFLRENERLRRRAKRGKGGGKGTK